MSSNVMNTNVFDMPPPVQEPEEVQLNNPTQKTLPDGESSDGDVWNDPDIIPVVNESSPEQDFIAQSLAPSEIGQSNFPTEQHQVVGQIGESIGQSVDKLRAFSPPSNEKFFIG
jgi:hypothetical protein